MYTSQGVSTSQRINKFVRLRGHHTTPCDAYIPIPPTSCDQWQVPEETILFVQSRGQEVVFTSSTGSYGSLTG